MKITLAIVGGGPTAIYILKHLAAHLNTISKVVHSICIFEKEDIAGIGMPYSATYNELCNMANISSEEIPMLHQSLVSWLKTQNNTQLAKFELSHSEISDSQVYPRLTLGQYFKNEYEHFKRVLSDKNICIKEYCNSEVIDISLDAKHKEFSIIVKNQTAIRCNKVIIASGHEWVHEDNLKIGYFASPWPIYKVLPSEGTYDNYTVGILGASLSAFDVVSSLSRRHGHFSINENKIAYVPDKETEHFKIVMHDMNGWLPHLQYEQKEPLRELYRHVTKEELSELLDEDGFFGLEKYFNRVCKPALQKAFFKDDMRSIGILLKEEKFGVSEFVKKMTELHEYKNAFEGMKNELLEARNSVNNHNPIHWKEVLDDLMYTLNFHAELMPAEDHYRFGTEVMPFLLNVIAALPLESAKIMLALHEKGKLEMKKGAIKVLNQTTTAQGSAKIELTYKGKTEHMEYRKFINCSGQQSITLETFPFKSLVTEGIVRNARAKIRDVEVLQTKLIEETKNEVFTEDGNWYMKLKGIDIDAHFRVKNAAGIPCSNLYNLSFSHTSGLRPYAYGLQVCELSSRIVIQAIIANIISDSEADEY